MSKKNKPKNQPPQPHGLPPSEPVISNRGWKIIGVGTAVLAIGYAVLSMTDSMAQNWAGHVSPFIIIGGYAIIGFGIVAKNPSI